MSAKVLYFEEVYPALSAVIESFNALNLEILYWAEMNEGQKETALAQADYFLVTGTKITGEMLEKAKALRMIQRLGIGLDNIDVQTATLRKIPVSNVPGGNSQSVAEFTIAMILNLYRKLTILDYATKKGEWPKWQYRLETYEMHGKTHGLIGMGNTGKITAQLSRAFGTKIIYYTRTRLPGPEEAALGITYLSLEDVLKNADIISLHVPLSPRTKHLIGRDELALMKKNTILINVSRGIAEQFAFHQIFRDRREINGDKRAVFS